MSRAFLALLGDPAKREALRDLLQGDIWQRERPRGIDLLASELERIEGNPAHPWYRELGGSA